MRKSEEFDRVQNGVVKEEALNWALEMPRRMRKVETSNREVDDMRTNLCVWCGRGDATTIIVSSKTPPPKDVSPTPKPTNPSDCNNPSSASFVKF